MYQISTEFEDVEIRHNFIQKVYSILGLQLFITFGWVLLCLYHEGINEFVLNHQELLLMSSIFFVIFYLILVCIPPARRMVPLNFILLSLMTIAMTYFCGVVSALYKAEIVLITLGITAFIVILITIIATQTRFDITKYTFLLFIFGLIILIYGIMAIIASFFYPTKLLLMVYSCLATIFFMVYLFFDTQIIFGGRRYELSAEEYIYGAIALYVDIIYIFLNLLYILKFLSE